MIVADVSQYLQYDNTFGINGNSFLYTLNKIYSDNNKTIKRVDNQDIEYYNYQNVLIVAKRTLINIEGRQCVEYAYKIPESEETSYIDEGEQEWIQIWVYININGELIYPLDDIIEKAQELNNIYDYNCELYEETNNDITVQNNYGEEFEEIIDELGGVGSSDPTQKVQYADLEDKPNLSTVATTGSYNDLIDKPTIPTSLSGLTEDSAHRFVSDTEKTYWNNKSNFSGNYSDLNGLPTNLVNTITLNRTIALLSILITDPAYTLQSSDSLVQIWVELINNNTYSINDVPNLSNLRTLVAQEIN